MCPSCRKCSINKNISVVIRLFFITWLLTNKIMKFRIVYTCIWAKFPQPKLLIGPGSYFMFKFSSHCLFLSLLHVIVPFPLINRIIHLLQGIFFFCKYSGILILGSMDVFLKSINSLKLYINVCACVWFL